MKRYNVIIVCSLFFVISLLNGREINKEIRELNKIMENYLFEYESFNYKQSYKKIDKLIKQFNQLDYLNGEKELLLIKIDRAIATGEENLIDKWYKEYERKLNVFAKNLCFIM